MPESVVTQLAGFRSIEEAGDAVSRDRGGGDPARPRSRSWTASRSTRPSRPTTPATRTGAGSVLLVELDGVAVQVEEDVAAVDAICRACGRLRDPHGPRRRDERALLWNGRKGAFAAMGRMSPDYYVQDGVVPRTKLPAVLRRIDELSAEHGLRVGNVFHAGDGNLHPLVLYDAAVEGDDERAKDARRGDPRRLRRRGRIAHGRARDRRRQGLLDAVDVLRARPRGLRAGVRNLREIAQQLGVANVVEGSVQRSGNRVRVNAQLMMRVITRICGHKPTIAIWPMSSPSKAKSPRPLPTSCRRSSRLTRRKLSSNHHH